MNYKKLYDKIILNRKTYEYDGYTENHHILPKSLGGTDEPCNLVSLSTREHFLCHYLLTKLHERETTEWYKMNHAFMMMKCSSYNQDRYYNSRLYETQRNNFSVVMSHNQTGNKNSQHGTRWIHNKILRKSKKIKSTQLLPNGWTEGRVINFDREQTKINEKHRKELVRLERDKKMSKYYKKLYIIYINEGYTQLINKSGWNKSQSYLVRQFNKYLGDEYAKTQGKKRGLII